MGTVGYMSPEQVKGQGSGPRSYIFRRGGAVPEICRARRAFQGARPAGNDVRHPEREIRRSSRRPRRKSLRGSSGSSATASRKRRGAVPVGAGSRVRSRVGFRTPWANSRPPPRLAGSCAPLRCSAQPPFSLARVSTGWSAITPGRKAVTFRRITFRRGDVAAARFTPDGDNVVYSAAFDGNPTEVYLTRRDGHDARPLGHAGHAVGRRLAYGRARGRPRRRAA